MISLDDGRGEQSAQNHGLQKTFADVMDYFDPELRNPLATRPTIQEFIAALQLSADGSVGTIRDFEFGYGIFDNPKKGGMFFVQMSPAQLLKIFDVSIKGARRELEQTTVDNWFAGVGSVHVIECTLTECTSDEENYTRRKQFEMLRDDQKQSISDQLEQLATEYEQKISELEISASNESHRENIENMRIEAADIRTVALAITKGKAPIASYDHLKPPPGNHRQLQVDLDLRTTGLLPSFIAEIYANSNIQGEHEKN
jgi:hypothetical protein